MASTNKTTNYELSQFEGTDKPSWEADYNADMLSIDTNLKAVSDVADGASGSISTLADRVTTAEGNITTNANDIDALEARADALEAGETAADGRLDAIEAEQIVQNTAIESNTRLGYNLARPYDSASTYNIGSYVLFQDTLYKCTTAITTGEAFDPTKWLAIKATDEIAHSILSTISINDPTLFIPNTATLTDIEGNITTLSNLTISQTFGEFKKIENFVIGYIYIKMQFDNITLPNDFTGEIACNFSYNTNANDYDFIHSLYDSKAFTAEIFPDISAALPQM